MGEYQSYIKEKNIEQIALFSKKYESEPEYRMSIEGKSRSIKVSQILDALQEQANTPVSTLDEDKGMDLYGWSIIHATDEEGKSHPFCLMRSLPTHFNDSYEKIRKDDEELANIILTEVYDLTKRKIKWIRFKNKIKNFFRGVLK